MKVLTLAGVFLAGALVGAQGDHRAMTPAATPTPGLQATVFNLPPPVPCRSPLQNISGPAASAPLSVRLYFEWVSLERQANDVVKDTLTKLTGQAFPTPSSHCPAPAHPITLPASRQSPPLPAGTAPASSHDSA